MLPQVVCKARSPKFIQVQIAEITLFTGPFILEKIPCPPKGGLADLATQEEKQDKNRKWKEDERKKKNWEYNDKSKKERRFGRQ